MTEFNFSYWEILLHCITLIFYHMKIHFIGSFVFNRILGGQTLPLGARRSHLQHAHTTFVLRGCRHPHREKTTFPSENFISRLENLIFPYSIRDAVGVHACRPSIHL
jgi:hypothetical protein